MGRYLKHVLGIASAPLSGLIGDYGFDALHGKCDILNCNLPTKYGFDLPAGGLTLSLGVGVPCLIVVLSCILIFKRNGCIILSGEEVQHSKEIQCIITALVFCYLIFILPIYIIEWIPYRPNTALVKIGVYTW